MLSTKQLAWWIAKGAPTPSIRASVRRALGRLEQEKLVMGDPASKTWVLTQAERRRERKRQEADGARRERRRDQEAEAEQKSIRAPPPPKTVDRALLAKLLGMLGSSHDGEVLNAARLVERERRRCGKTWEELLEPVDLGLLLRRFRRR
jgi:hypothetical protein